MHAPRICSRSGNIKCVISSLASLQQGVASNDASDGSNPDCEPEQAENEEGESANELYDADRSTDARE
jgi:hypothetical protein